MTWISTVVSAFVCRLAGSCCDLSIFDVVHLCSASSLEGVIAALGLCYRAVLFWYFVSLFCGGETTDLINSAVLFSFRCLALLVLYSSDVTPVANLHADLGGRG